MSENIFVIVTATGCGHCNVLKQGNPSILDNIRNKLSTIPNLRYEHINFESMGNDVNAVAKLNNIKNGLSSAIRGFPTFMLIIDNQIIPYNDQRNAESIYSWVISNIKQVPASKPLTTLTEDLRKNGVPTGYYTVSLGNGISAQTNGNKANLLVSTLNTHNKKTGN